MRNPGMETRGLKKRECEFEEKTMMPPKLAGAVCTGYVLCYYIFVGVCSCYESCFVAYLPPCAAGCRFPPASEVSGLKEVVESGDMLLPAPAVFSCMAAAASLSAASLSTPFSHACERQRTRTEMDKNNPSNIIRVMRMARFSI